VGLLIGRSRNCNVPVRDNVDGVIDQNLNLQYLLSWFWEGILVTSSFCDITITIFLSTSTGVRKNQYFSRTGSSISTIYGSTGTNKEKREKKGILMESCMPDYFIYLFYKFNSLSEAVFASCRCFYVHFYVQHRHSLKNTNNELPSYPCCCCHPAPYCIENGGYPSRHQINNTGTNNISKGVPCFTDIRCHMLVWNLS
jgi:hypothetical protein